VLFDVISHASQHVQVCLLVRDEAHQRALADKLRRANLAQANVRFLEAPFAEVWVRDFGPFVVKSFNGGYELLDLGYAQSLSDPSPDRQLDDGVPSAVATSLGMQAVRVPLVVDGGNLLSNGAGLCVTTSTLQEANPGLSWDQIGDLVRRHFGGRQLVVLDTLVGEPSGHADMFCTFTAPDTIVVASCDPRLDPQNAAILDQNARRLSGLETPCGPLKVVRLPMRPRRELRWMTYTNVIYANGLLLVPSYAPDADPEVERQVLATYRGLLPGWRIVSIQAAPLLDGLGSLHCVAMNLGGLGTGEGTSTGMPRW
jgi:agmatine/peptidylarginine deiminase